MGSLTQQGVFFVTRFKSDLQHEVMEDRSVPQNRNIRADPVVRLRALTKTGTYTNSAPVSRSAVLPCTFPVFTFIAA